MEDIKISETVSPFVKTQECKVCDYKCCKKSDLLKHLSTAKHLVKVGGYANDIAAISKVAKSIDTVCLCGNIYKHHSGLWRHKKKCTAINQPVPNPPVVEGITLETKEKELINEYER